MAEERTGGDGFNFLAPKRQQAIGRQIVAQTRWMAGMVAGWLLAGALLLAAGEIPGKDGATMTDSGPEAAFTAATAEQLARDFLAAESLQVAHVKAFRMPGAASGWWMVEYRVAGRPAHGSGPRLYVNEKTREVTRQAPKGSPGIL